MVRTVGDDESEQRVIDDVAKFGWHCVHILAEGESPEYSFTLGLFHTHKHPELIIFGLSSKVAHQILTTVANAAKSGRALDLSQPTDELLNDYSCCFVEVPPSEYFEHVGFCRWYYEGSNSFPLYQIVWPSRSGLFPWHAQATEAFRAGQPVLGHAARGT